MSALCVCVWGGGTCTNWLCCSAEIVCLKEFVARTDWWKWGRWGGGSPEAESDVGGHVTSGLQHSTVATMCAECYVPTMYWQIVHWWRICEKPSHSLCSATCSCSHTARAFSTSSSTILTAQSTCLPHTTIQRTNHSLLFSSEWALSVLRFGEVLSWTIQRGYQLLCRVNTAGL